MVMMKMIDDDNDGLSWYSHDGYDGYEDDPDDDSIEVRYYFYYFAILPQFH